VYSPSVLGDKMKDCISCYTCEKGIVKHITVNEFRKAKEANAVPIDWFLNDAMRCENCVDCQKCYSGQGAGTEGRKGGNSVNYFLFLTNECNLRCSYCYATKVPLVMTRETIEQVKLFLTRDEELRIGAHETSVQFFGGEPTLRWDDLQCFVTEFTALYDKLYGRKVRWGMTTNATQLTRERLEFMKQYGITPLLSIDGRPETHDIHRRCIDGSGSSQLIDIDLIREYFPTAEIRPTITPESIENWMDDVKWFHSKGFYIVATEVAYEANWTDEKMAAARRTYEALADVYVERRMTGQPAWMKFIEDGLAFAGVPEQKGKVCGIGLGGLAIDSAGKLYACQRYASMSDPSLALGDIWRGLDEHKLATAQNLSREDMVPDPASGYQCAGCVARWRCRGGCNAMNYQVTGDRRYITKSHCDFHRMWAEISLVALARTGELFGKRYSQPRGCDLPLEK
jgi:uncharacterized protein